jgi:hypothetical protein
VTVENTGNQATGALTASVTGSDFTITGGSIASIAAGGTGAFTVRPTTTGLAFGIYTATVTVSGGNITAKSFDVSFDVGTWTTFVYNDTTNPEVTVKLRDDAAWRSAATPAARLAKLSGSVSSENSNCTFNSIGYQRRYIRSIAWGNDVEGATALGNYFLHYFTGLTSLDLSPLAGIASIGNGFLRECAGLQSLDLTPLTGITSIGTSFLWGCSGLTEIDLAALSEVTSLDYFMGYCSGLTEIDLRPLTKATSFDGSFLFHCYNLKKVDLPTLTGIFSIGFYFLAYCNSLTELDMTPLAGVDSIDGGFLMNCTSLVSADMRGIACNKMLSNAFLIDISIRDLPVPVCTVTVSDNPQDWRNRFTSAHPGILFQN